MTTARRNTHQGTSPHHQSSGKDMGCSPVARSCYEIATSPRIETPMKVVECGTSPIANSNPSAQDQKIVNTSVSLEQDQQLKEFNDTSC